MSNYYTLTSQYVKKLNIALKNATKASLPSKIIFGGGGFNSGTGEIRNADPDSTSADDAYLTKNFSIVYADGDAMVYVGIIDRNELNNYKISQICVLDSDNILMAKMNFYEQLKVAGNPMTVKIKLPF